MALREDQIQRYSRQILLREVGGRGQRRLLEAPVLVVGRSQALDVAVAVLGASGTPLVGADGPRGGYVEGTSLPALSLDAVAGDGVPPRGWLGPAAEAAAAPVTIFRVGLSASGLWGVPAGVAWPAVSASDGPDAEPVTLGAMAALVAQRYALGLEAGAVEVQFRDGRWTRL